MGQNGYRNLAIKTFFCKRRKTHIKTRTHTEKKGRLMCVDYNDDFLVGFRVSEKEERCRVGRIIIP